MCIDFTDLNVIGPKYPYPLTNIDRLIEGYLGYRMLSFMDAYSGYIQIKTDPIDAPKMEFMSHHDNYYYNIIPFGLNNVGVTYQRLMNVVLSKQIGHNLEVYIYDMIMKTSEGEHHAVDFKDILVTISNYNMCFNLDKCSFSMQADKFLSFMLTKRDTEDNSDRFQAIIDIRSPLNVKEVHQLTKRLVSLSHFLSCAGDNAFHFFTILKKHERF